MSNTRRARIEGGIGRFDVEGRLSDASREMLLALDKEIKRQASRKKKRYRLYPGDKYKGSHKKASGRVVGKAKKRDGKS